jgi:hypothetical protein
MASLTRLLALAALFGSLLLIQSCTSDAPPAQQEARRLNIPAFNRDSAYAYVAKQVSFGPRVVNSEGHRQCREWLVGKFGSMGATVIEQDFTAEAYTGETLRGTNIIAQFNPDATKRILLGAHWDTRHIADSPLNEERVDEPILGADDGASGVAVLLEIMRQLQLDTQQVDLGVDVVLFDAEDYGESGGEADTYALGSQYWSRNLHTPHKPQFGILLDMVGARNAVFPVEGFSYRFAPNVVENIWRLAEQMGYGNYFRFEDGGAVTDDHYFVNTIARIPMVDIINLPRTNEETTFGDHWHTHNDNLDIIDSRTLRAVGQVVLAVIYREAQ